MTESGLWKFCIDRGGTFTDVVARDPRGGLHVRKLLSEDPEHYEDAPLEAIRRFLGVADPRAGIPGDRIESVRMGTTVATNALLERRGAPVCLVVTRGFADLLEIGYQNRPDIFALEIRKPSQLSCRVIELRERVRADGTVAKEPELADLRTRLRNAHAAGIRSVAVVLLNSYVNPAHEKVVGEIAREIGFDCVSLSHETAGEIKAVARGDTTVADAYLTPILRDYVERVRAALGDEVDLRFMQSHGGLAEARHFTGKDAVFSGPAGGVVACAHVAERSGYGKVIGFDMGGTSTDVCRYDGEYERVFENVVAGVRIQAPMLNIVTVAAGGGSVLHFEDGRMTVGPDSAGANPGPACYRRGGPPAVTDANAVLGRIQPKYFPLCFGPGADEPPDADASRDALADVARRVKETGGGERSVEEIAAGFLRIANENMAKPIREISIARGYDVREYALVCFGGAGAQHACAVAESLGMRTVLLHPLAGVLSAYGLGLADVIRADVEAVMEALDAGAPARLEPRFAALEERARRDVAEQGIDPGSISCIRSMDLRYEGVETYLNVPVSGADPRGDFERMHGHLYGFAKPGHPVEIVNVRVETRGETPRPAEPSEDLVERTLGETDAIDSVRIHFDVLEAGGDRKLRELATPVFRREDLASRCALDGPALVVEDVSTVVVDPGWRARVDAHGCMILEAVGEPGRHENVSTECDPVLLEIFNNLFMSVAEQMGIVLRKVSHSTNIKERLDFSCAVFDSAGELVANAPHIPVHLGSMSESVKPIIAQWGDAMRSGDVYVTNDPYDGGTHLPDVTVVTPVFGPSGKLIFFAASRGHHADIGGVTPGSMPPFSTTIEEEGVLLHNVKLAEDGRFLEEEISELLGGGRYPARNLLERLSDLRAAVAANAAGARFLQEVMDHYGMGAVRAYMQHVKDNTERAMRSVLSRLPDGEHAFVDFLDDGERISVTIRIAGDTATIDFTGTDPQVKGNLNAPRAVVTAAVMYVVRTLIPKQVPMNAGCLVPIDIVVPEGSVIDPRRPAAVAGGNVETSMRITDVLYGALGIIAAGQGTMNNLTFGTGEFSYYETICGGAGAGPGFDGADAVHTHMTNTRITDPEVIERRYPVMVRSFSVRKGSGGHGVWHGGDGVRREMEFLQPMSVSILSERRLRRPYGLHGAGDGEAGRNLHVTGGKSREVAGKAGLDVEPGDVVVIETPGGGGYSPSRGEWGAMRPADARRIFRERRYTGPTAGMSAGYVQANLVIVPEDAADDFEEYCRVNPKPCPLLDRLATGSVIPSAMAPGADIRTDIPLYRIFHADCSYDEVPDISDRFEKVDVAFLLGCSFSFEEALIEAGLVPRHIEEGVNVPMYRTNRRTTAAGPFDGPLVVTMRPVPADRIRDAHDITAPYECGHGAPVHHGDAGDLGIRDLANPDWGDAVTVRPGEVPVFWACGVTSQVAVESALRRGVMSQVITHSPGCMFITDVLAHRK